jgi:hypothetical protein
VQTKDYSNLLGEILEIHRSDNDYNVGRNVKVLEVKGDALRVEVLENCETFWTDVESVYHYL